MGSFCVCASLFIYAVVWLCACESACMNICVAICVCV